MSHVFYIKIEGSKTAFIGEGQDPNENPASLGLGFEQAVTTPRDLASGQATGKRQHSPITITKEWGAASPQLFQALVSNELLKTVQFDFYEPPPGSTEGSQRFFTIKLSSAFVSKIEQYQNFNAVGHQDANDQRFLEDVSFIYQKIDVVHVGSKSSATASLP